MVSDWVWFAKTNVSLAANAGMVASLEADGARLEIVVVFVVPRTNWLVVLANVAELPEKLPIPEMFGVPEPVILPVKVYAPMFEVEMVLTANVPVVPLSVKVRSVFGVAALSLIVRTPAASVAPNVITGLVLDKVIGAVPERIVPAKVGVAPVLISCGSDKVMEPAPLVTLTWLVVPVKFARV